MTGYALSFSGANLIAQADGALWWPDKRVLCVSDLHLGKSERIARRGGTLLPPYETRDTLWRLDASIRATDPQCVICLGDSFDDLAAAQAVSDEAREILSRLQAGRDWVWIEGNHDPGPVDIGGTHRTEVTIDTLTFRHIADSAATAEVSGHYHPKAAPKGLTQRACFLVDHNKLIMPAFGAYTGGLGLRDKALADLVDPSGLAILLGRQAVAVPISACLRR